MTGGVACGSCGAGLRQNAGFCDGCGAPAAVSGDTAKYKQRTVLFADVVHSMDIAAAMGAERLREMMAVLISDAPMLRQWFWRFPMVGGPLGPQEVAETHSRRSLCVCRARGSVHHVYRRAGRSP